MDLHHVRYFLAVCETLNFTKAASNCNVSQPALSRAIQQLEEEVGGLLFRRERSLTHMTDLGILMKPHFERIDAEVGDVKREVRNFLTLEKASLNVGVMCTIAPTRFSSMLSKFSRDYPGISLRMTEGAVAKLSDQLENGEIDVALMASAENFPERFDCEALYKERFVIAFPTGHRFSQMSVVPIAAIDGENYLQRINCEYVDKLTQLTDAHNADLPVVYASEREDWIQNMVAGGLGICFIPEFSAVLPGIQSRPIIDPEVSREICFVTMAGRRHSPVLTSFLKSLRGISFPDSRFQADRILVQNALQDAKA